MGRCCKVASPKLQDGDGARRTREFLQHNPMHMPGNDFLHERSEAQGGSDATESSSGLRQCGVDKGLRIGVRRIPELIRLHEIARVNSLTSVPSSVSGALEALPARAVAARPSITSLLIRMNDRGSPFTVNSTVTPWARSAMMASSMNWSTGLPSCTGSAAAKNGSRKSMARLFAVT